jgi:hypothetical protein
VVVESWCREVELERVGDWEAVTSEEMAVVEAAEEMAV